MKTNRILPAVGIVGAAGDVTVVLAGAPLDFPASIEFEQDVLYATNFALLNAQAGKGNPGLIRIEHAE